MTSIGYHLKKQFVESGANNTLQSMNITEFPELFLVIGLQPRLAWRGRELWRFGASRECSLQARQARVLTSRSSCQRRTSTLSLIPL